MSLKRFQLLRALTDVARGIKKTGQPLQASNLPEKSVYRGRKTGRILSETEKRGYATARARFTISIFGTGSPRFSPGEPLLRLMNLSVTS
ncbi:MAG: hypothetical protein CME31_04215 [Gimesia sp.]|uniref:Uncharacterized protein n=1 Tax=Gimesia maris TaxID=122 RepID=A0A3D3R748_9PLAN|nr:hypothetical protein [Gimesia sp.]HCO24714.1 hypothetical protein [Gimesia maris]